MSLGLEKLVFIPTIDPRLDVQMLEKQEYAIEACALQNTYQVFPVQSFNQSSITAVCNPPNRSVMINRKFYAQVQYLLTFNGTSGGLGINLLQAAGLPTAAGVSGGNAYYDAPRAYPLSNSFNNLQVSLNNDTNNTNLNIYYRALTRYHNYPDCQDGFESITPSMLDQFLNYADGIGFARSELRGYGDNVLQCPRGGFINAVITSNSALGTSSDQATVLLTVLEPLNLSPLGLSCEHDKPSFLQVDTCTVVLSLGGRGNSNAGGLISSLWSHAVAPVSPSTFSSTSVQVVGANMFFQYFTPPLSFQIPRHIIYDYTSPIYYGTTNSLTSISAGTQTTLNLQNIQLNSIPEKMYLWVTVRDQDTTYSSTDTYFSIQNINITFNNVTGILSTAQVSDLYNIAKRNGFNGSYRQFQKDVGSVMCLKFGEDIPLNSDLLSAGTRGSYNISAQVQCTNNYNTSIIPTLSALFIHTGTFTINEGQCYRELGLLTENDVLATKHAVNSEMPPSYKQALEMGDGDQMIGGYIPHPQASHALGGLKWSDITSFFKRLGRTGINIAKVIVPNVPALKEFIPLVDLADRAAKSAGFGKMRGGKKLTRDQMIRRMK